MPVTTLTVAALEAAGFFRSGSDLYNPLLEKFGLASSADQAQGYKLHLSASRSNMHTVLPAAINRLLELGDSRQLTFKVNDPTEFEKMLDSNNSDGKGKFIAIYPSDRAHAIEVAAALEGLLVDDHEPVTGELQIIPGKNLYLRFGVFTDFIAQKENGFEIVVENGRNVKRGKLRTATGAIISDPRGTAFPEDMSQENTRFRDDFLAHRHLRGAAAPAAVTTSSSTHAASTAPTAVESLARRFDLGRLEELLRLEHDEAAKTPEIAGVKIGRPPNASELTTLRALALFGRNAELEKRAAAYFRNAQRFAESAERSLPKREEPRRRAPQQE